jgi:hypothetical protein
MQGVLTRSSFALGALTSGALAAYPQRIAAAGSYAQNVLAARPVAYWKLGEKSGLVAHDASGNGHDGTFEGSPSFGQPGAIAGDEGGSVRFDGRRDYVAIPDSPHFSQPDSGRGLTVDASYDIVSAHGDAPVRLGTRDLASFFTGALDDVAIYPRVLGAAEIAAHYRAGSA